MAEIRKKIKNVFMSRFLNLNLDYPKVPKSKDFLILSLALIFLFVVSFVFVEAGSIARSFSSPSVPKGGSLSVNLSVILNSSDNFYIIEDFIPFGGWSLVYFGGGNVNLTANSRRIVFVNYTSPANGILSYVITSPTTTGSYVFGGNYTMGNNFSNVIGGSNSITVNSCIISADCNDGVSCTNDYCDTVTGECSINPNDNACNDGLFCNGVEFCDAQLGCRAGTPITCSDSFTCTENVCSEASSSCNPPLINNSRCNSGEICSPTNFPAPIGCGLVGSCVDLDNDKLFDYDAAVCPTGKDICPFTNDTYFVNNPAQLDNYLPTNGSLNISNINRSNILGYDNFTIELNQIGKIIFKQRVKLYRINESGCFEKLDFNLTKFVDIKNKKIFVNSSHFSEFNKQARLQFNNIEFTDPKIQRDGSDCLTCNEISYINGVFVVDVSGFSTYEVVEGFVAANNNNYGSPGGSGGDGGAPTMPQCNDKKDNDGDRKIDYPNDTGCTSLIDNSELDVSEINITRGAFCVENWVCGDYNECVNGEKTRTCDDTNNCGTTAKKPTLSEECSVGGENAGGPVLNKIILTTLLSVFGAAVIVAIIILLVKRYKAKKSEKLLTQSIKFDQPAVVLLTAIAVFILLMVILGSFSNNFLFSPSSMSVVASSSLFYLLLFSALFSFVMWLVVMNRNAKRKKKVNRKVRRNKKRKI